MDSRSAKTTPVEHIGVEKRREKRNREVFTVWPPFKFLGANKTN